MPMTDAERKAAHRTATRHLHVHGPRDVRRDLAALAEEAPEGERGDHYGKGELHEAFEKEIAALLGKPAAVFMPSGTMAQQIALRIWSDRRGGAPVAFHPTSHVELHEQRAALHGDDAPDAELGVVGVPQTVAHAKAAHAQVPRARLRGARERGAWTVTRARADLTRSRGAVLGRRIPLTPPEAVATLCASPILSRGRAAR